MSLLDVQNLSVIYPGARAFGRRSRHPDFAAVDDVSFSLEAGEILGIVGESGSGKTSVARCITGFLAPSSGVIRLGGELLPTARPRHSRRRIQMVFQDPYSSLNPRMTIGQAIREPIRVHRLRPRDAIDARAEELIRLVGLDPALIDARPRELSGGQRQRASIARALALEPDLLIADEPVSALDVSVQAVVLNLLARLRAQMGLSMVLISHDLAVVSYLCDRVAVMSDGRVVETGPTPDVFASPQHPYTARLLAAVPPHPGAFRTRPPDHDPQ